MPIVLLADPGLLRSGPLELRWSGALLAAGLLLGYLAVQAVGARSGLVAQTVRDAALWSLPEALLAARAAHVLGHLDVYLVDPARLVQPWDGGFSFGAGLLVGAWAVWRYARGQGLAAGRLLDAAVPGLLLAQAFAALGQALDVAILPTAPLPPWDRAPSELGDAAGAPAVAAWRAAAVAAPVATGLWALGLLAGYAALARRRLAAGRLFLAYLALQALGQVLVRVGAAHDGALDGVGVIAWLVVGVVTILGALYHLRSGRFGPPSPPILGGEDGRPPQPPNPGG